jgi:hypothetical protein
MDAIRSPALSGIPDLLRDAGVALASLHPVMGDRQGVGAQFLRHLELVRRLQQ